MKKLRSVYLQSVTGVVLCGLVSEGLTEEQRVFVINLIPVFAVAQVQDGFDVAGAFLMLHVDLFTDIWVISHCNTFLSE